MTQNPDPLFQFPHQPFAYFKQYADGTEAKREHLKDEADLIKAIESNSLPAVAFYKPIGPETQHPGYADVESGDQHAANIISKIERSPSWSSTVIVVTYDENGGFWDHVPPPVLDQWGPGLRVPTLIISPFARRGCPNGLRASIGAKALREIAVFAGDHAMTIARRQFLQLAGAGLLAVTPLAFASEDYPTRPVRWIIGFPPSSKPSAFAQASRGASRCCSEVAA